MTRIADLNPVESLEDNDSLPVNLALGDSTRRASIPVLAEAISRHIDASARVAALESDVARLFTTQGQMLLVSGNNSDPFGSVAAQPVINELLQESGATGKPVVVTPGNYRLTGRVLVPSNSSLINMPGVVYQQDFDVTGTSGVITNSGAITTKSNNVKIIGGKIQGPSDYSRRGNLVCLNGDDIIIDGLDMDYYGRSGRAMLLFGDRMIVNRCRAFRGKIVGGGGGAFRFAGGRDFIGSNLYGFCDDDVFQFVPGAAGNVLGNLDIINGLYVNCTGFSQSARLMVIALVDRDADGGSMTCKAVNNGWIGVRGGGRVHIQNQDSTGDIFGNYAAYCSADMSHQVDANRGTYCVETSTANSSEVMDTTFYRCSSVNTPRWSVQTLKGNFKDPRGVRFIDCDFDAPTQLGYENLFIKNGQGIYFRGGSAGAGPSGTGQQGLCQVGSGGVDVTDFKMEGMELTGIKNGQRALNLVNVNGFKVADNELYPATGATTARGVRGQAQARNGRVIGNNVSRVQNERILMDVKDGTVKVADNIGHRTFAQGSVTMLAASTSATVNHNLDGMTGTFGRYIRLTVIGIAGYGAATRLWVTDINDTSFIIRSDVAPGVNITIAWEFNAERQSGG